jgi:hypothetical protein
MREALSILGYMARNPDFEKMWNSGEIQAFIAENPGHNYLSAHEALKARNAEKTWPKAEAQSEAAPSVDVSSLNAMEWGLIRLLFREPQQVLQTVEKV